MMEKDLCFDIHFGNWLDVRDARDSIANVAGATAFNFHKFLL